MRHYHYYKYENSELLLNLYDKNNKDISKLKEFLNQYIEYNKSIDDSQKNR